MPLYTATIKFSHIKSRLTFSYQTNMGTKGQSSCTFFFKEAVSIKVVDTDDYFNAFSDIIEGVTWNGTSFEMFPMENTKCYLISDGRYYKIGKSIDPLKRLSELKTANPSCKLICYSQYVPERFLQSVYKHKHFSLEWFKLEQSDVSFIKSLMLVDNYLQTQCIMRMCSRMISKNKPKTNDIKGKKISSQRLTFGKYKGKKISEMGTPEQLQYLSYLKKNWTGDKKSYLYQSICQRCNN